MWRKYDSRRLPRKKIQGERVLRLRSTDRDECSVFQLYPIPFAYISLEDAREMYELCQQIRKKDPLHAETVYQMHNMSKEGIEEYLAIVEYYERCWCLNYTEEDIEKNIHKD